MKRSEIVDIIYKELLFWNNSNSKYKQVASPLKEELADILLKTIEEAGMLPPSTNYFIVNKPEGFIQTYSEVSDYHEWEPEA